MRCSSGKQGTAPSELTASTRTSGPSSGRAEVQARRSVSAPVEVSLCVKSIAAAPGCCSRASRTSEGVAVRPRGMSTGRIVAPLRDAISRKRSPNAPHEKEMTASPGSSRLAARASSAPVPDDGSVITGCEARSSFFKSAAISSSNAKYVSLLCPTRGAAPAARTECGTSTGPGVKRWGCMNDPSFEYAKGRKGVSPPASIPCEIPMLRFQGCETATAAASPLPAQEDQPFRTNRKRRRNYYPCR